MYDSSDRNRRGTATIHRTMRPRLIPTTRLPRTSARQYVRVFFITKWLTYITQSQVDGSCYDGHTHDLALRVIHHNEPSKPQLMIVRSLLFLRARSDCSDPNSHKFLLPPCV